jgi:hypothetical protein
MSDQSREPIPIHPEEMKTTYDVRIGKSVTLQGTARITPAGVIALGVALSAVALSLAALARAKQSRQGALERLSDTVRRLQRHR